MNSIITEVTVVNLRCWRYCCSSIYFLWVIYQYDNCFYKYCIGVSCVDRAIQQNERKIREEEAAEAAPAKEAVLVVKVKDLLAKR